MELEGFISVAMIFGMFSVVFFIFLWIEKKLYCLIPGTIIFIVIVASLIVFTQGMTYKDKLNVKLFAFETPEGVIQVVNWFDEKPRFQETKGYFSNDDNIMSFKSQYKFWFIYGKENYEIKKTN